MSEINKNSVDQMSSSPSENKSCGTGLDSSKKSSNCLNNHKDNTSSKEFIQQYRQYRDAYYKQPSDKRNGRAMNLLEFTRQNLTPPSGSYKYDLDDPIDKILYDLEKNPQQSTRQYLEEYTEKLMSENRLKRKQQYPSLYSSDKESSHRSETIDSPSNGKSVIDIDSNDTCTNPIILSDTEEQQEQSQTLVVLDSNKTIPTPSYVYHIPSFITI